MLLTRFSTSIISINNSHHMPKLALPSNLNLASDSNSHFVFHDPKSNTKVLDIPNHPNTKIKFSINSEIKTLLIIEHPNFTFISETKTLPIFEYFNFRFSANGATAFAVSKASPAIMTKNIDAVNIYKDYPNLHEINQDQKAKDFDQSSIKFEPKPVPSAAANLVFSGTINFTIKNIPIYKNISVNSIKNIKKYLTVSKVLRESQLPEEERNKAITSEYKNLDILQRKSNENFLRDNLVNKGNFQGYFEEKINTEKGIMVKQYHFSLPPELTELIGSFVDGNIKSLTVNDNFSMFIEKSNDPVDHLGSLVNPSDSEI